MPGPINVKSPNNISEWQMGFNSAFKGLTEVTDISLHLGNVIFLFGRGETIWTTQSQRTWFLCDKQTKENNV